MKKENKEGQMIALYIRRFLTEEAPNNLTGSEHTLNGYKTALRMYTRFLEAEKGITITSFSGDCFCKANIEEWLQWLQTTQGNGPSTCRPRLSSLRMFLKYLYDKDPAFASLYADAKMVQIRRPPKTKVNGLSRQAVKTIFELPDLKTRTGQRDLTFMEILYMTAARIDEILSLKVKMLRLDVKQPYVIITGKGGKTRSIALLPQGVAILRKYLKAFHGDNPDPEAYVFYTPMGGVYSKLTQPAIYKRLRKYAKTGHAICTEIPLNLHAHHFRHARASHWLEDGMNIVQISFLLGHESVATTMRYLDITVADKADALATLENEKHHNIPRKWKKEDGSLEDILGLK